MALVLSKPQYEVKGNSPRPTGKLASHRPSTFTYDTIFNILCMIYVYDGEFVFESSTDIEKLITLISNHFAQFGLEINIGTKKNL